MYNETRVRKSELLQLILLDNLYAQSGSERVIFQGGTALRWVYGGMRFSEDLDFVTILPKKDIQRILNSTFKKTQMACIAQFGPGQWETTVKGKRETAIRIFYIYRPETGRERIAVKLEFELLKAGRQPRFERFILKDLPLVAGLMTSGKLIMPYSSTIILSETPEEILSDKIRSLYERKYIKGRDIYDVWWLKSQLKVIPGLDKIRQKLSMYQIPFVPVRKAEYFLKQESVLFVLEALEKDLARFIPQNIFLKYKESNFADFIASLTEVTGDLLKQGLAKLLEDYEGTKRND
jgi:predicted nucleotidyltransferase component of viral defense system